MIILVSDAKSSLELQLFCKKYHSQVDLIEVRLDFFSNVDLEILDHLNQKYSLLLTLRSSSEFGKSSLVQNNRHKLLKQIIDIKPKYLDIEFKRDLKLFKYLNEHSKKTKVILSYHLKRLPSNLDQTISKMKAHKTWKTKLACYAESTIDSLKMLKKVQEHKDFIGICMGEYGVCTRLLGPIYGQSVSYCSTNDSSLAPGQLSLDQMQNFYHYKSYDKKTKVLGLIGHPVKQSPGVKKYNKLFKQKNINAIYINFDVLPHQLKPFLNLSQKLKFYGFSITIPHKLKIAKLAGSIKSDKKGIQAINTLKYTPKGYIGINSDGLGAVEILKKYQLKDQKVLIVGAGGTAYGIGYMLRSEGAKVSICNRSLINAQVLARSLKGDIMPIEQLNALNGHDYDILIHTTPIGTNESKESLVPLKSLYKGKVVLDVVLNKTQLIKWANSKKCFTLDGFEFWQAQSIEQLRFWF